MQIRLWFWYLSAALWVTPRTAVTSCKAHAQAWRQEGQERRRKSKEGDLVIASFYLIFREFTSLTDWIYFFGSDGIAISHPTKVDWCGGFKEVSIKAQEFHIPYVDKSPCVWWWLLLDQAEPQPLAKRFLANWFQKHKMMLNYPNWFVWSSFILIFNLGTFLRNVSVYKADPVTCMMLPRNWMCLMASSKQLVGMPGQWLWWPNWSETWVSRCNGNCEKKHLQPLAEILGFKFQVLKTMDVLDLNLILIIG